MVTTIIITLNEEQNIPHAIRSVYTWSDIFVVDSGSTDKTCQIAEELGAHVVYHKFKNYSDQRNWALDNVPFDNEWVLFLDADEMILPELQSEILKTIPTTKYDGFFIKRRIYFLGAWIKHGGIYPTWLLRLLRKGKGRFEREVNEHLRLDGLAGKLQNEFVDYDRKGLTNWLHKHIRYAELEAKLVENKANEKISFIGDFIFGTQQRRKKWLRYGIYLRFPLVIRAFIFFFYRYVFKLGFLDGMAGYVYYILHDFWFKILVDIYYLQSRKKFTQ